MGTRDTAFLTTVAVMAGVFGLAVGSFLNVVAYRVPLGFSISAPRSFCPDCGEQLTWWQNVPLVSWILLRGRCRRCQRPISLRYPAVELATGVVFAWIAWELDGSLAAAGYCCLAASMVAVLLIECSGHRAPLAVAGIGTVMSLAVFAAASVRTGDWRTLLGPLVGASAGLVALAALRLLDPTAGHPHGAGRTALLVAGCWLGGMGSEAVVATAVGAGTYALCVLPPWVFNRPRVHATSGQASPPLTASLVAAPIAVSLATAMIVALLALGWQ
jgi:leader peptidase (prepilin peptidase) / N-methyltransferase